MSKALNVLEMRLDGLSANAKCLLVKTLSRGYEAVGGMSIDELSGQFGLTKQVLVRARKELFDPVKKYSGGYLMEAALCQPPLNRDPRGRPRKGFHVNPAFLNDLNDGWLTPNAEICLFLINRPVQKLRSNPKKLAKGQKLSKGDADERDKDRLSALNLYFLALLWALADDMGAIWGRGVGEIARLAGMSRAQADNQLTKLERLGYVRARVGGVTATRIFGRASGSILLNPVHPDIRPDGLAVPWIWQEMTLGENLPQTLVYKTMLYWEADRILASERQEEQDRKQLAALIRAKRRSGQHKAWIERDAEVHRLRLRIDGIRFRLNEKKRNFERRDGEPIQILDLVPGDVGKTRPNTETAWDLHRAFVRASPGLREYVALMVCRYATKILQLRPLIDPSASIVVSEPILSDLKDVLFVRAEDPPFSDPGWWWVLASWFYRESYDLARQILHWRRYSLGLAPGQRLPRDCRYLVFPRLHLGRLDILVDEVQNVPVNVKSSD